MISRIARIFVGTVALVSVSAALFAQEAKPKIKVEVNAKQVSGIITSISPSFIAVESGLNEEKTVALEATFNLAKGVRVIHKTFKELQVGDTVSVSYEETMKTLENGKKSRSTNVISITFLKPAPKDLTSQGQPEAPSGGAPSDEPQDEGTLSLKGLKER
jgi:hypothetical protein